MRIACPSCDAAYDVPAERLLPGKSVRCAKCGMVWEPVARVDAAPPIPVEKPPPPTPAAPPTPLPDVPETTVLAPHVPEPDPVVAEAAPAPARQARRGRALVALAWVASLAILGVAGYAAVTYRAAVMQAWPPSIRAYAVLGLVRQ